MDWEEDREQQRMSPENVKAHRPVAEVIIGPHKHFRHPAVQAEIERRVAIYTQQVEQTGLISWLTYRGSGE